MDRRISRSGEDGNEEEERMQNGEELEGEEEEV